MRISISSSNSDIFINRQLICVHQTQLSFSDSSEESNPKLKNSVTTTNTISNEKSVWS